MIEPATGRCQSGAVRERWKRWQPGFRQSLPFGLAAIVLGATYGVVAEPVIGGVLAILMSAFVFGGSAQFASTAVLAAGGSPGAAILAGVLLHLRFLAMGIALAPSLHGGPLQRAVEGQTSVDASWALASRGDGTFDRNVLFGGFVAQYPLWVGGTILGVVAGDVLGDPDNFGVDALLPAFFLVLLVEEARTRGGLAAALLGGAIALVLVPFVPPGIPVLAACLAALVGLTRLGRPA